MTLSVVGVTKHLGGRAVLRGVNLSVPAGAAVALLGANGAGKSTLLRIVAGVLTADAGEVLLDGASLLAGDGAARRQLGYVPEHPDALPHLTVAELLRLVAALKRAPLPPPELLERLGATPLLDRRTHALSLGQRRRAFLAAALVGDPKLIVLDEPTNGLDPDGVRMLSDLLLARCALGCSVLAATHDLTFAASLSATPARLAASGTASGTVLPN